MKVTTSSIVKLSIAAVLLIAGCEAEPLKPAVDEPAQQAESQETAGASQRPATISISEPPSVFERNLWDSEAFSSAAQSQLNVIANWVKDPAKVSGEQLSNLITPSFQSHQLRPERLSTVFEDHGLTVQRPEAIATDSAVVQNGAEGFLRALHQLTAPLTDASDVRCKLKIFGVDMEADQATTAVVVRLGGRTAIQAIQQTSEWECRWTIGTPQTPPRLKSISITKDEQTSFSGPSDRVFADCTESVLGGNESFHQQLVYGLGHWLHRLELYYGIIATSYHGLAVGDVNGDGLDDVYLCQPGGISGGLPNRLYLQQPDGTARDVSAEAGVDWLTETHSALFIDLDNDGDQDLVAATMAGVIMAENNGEGIFRPRQFKLIPDGPPISLAAADFDNDGDLDIYACCYARRATAEGMVRPVPYHDANNGSRNVLLRNDRDWRFSNVTQQVGLDKSNRRFSLACAWEDFDNDGDQDLYVANDFGRNNLYRNDDGIFTDVAAELGVEDMSAGMSVSWGDGNNDGWMDLYVSNMWSSAGNRIAFQRQFLEDSVTPETRGGFQRHARGNSLFTNLGAGDAPLFSDGSVSAGVTVGGWAWSSQFADINNDGWQDLIVANGYITQESTQDL
ncbi:MAG: hypothetical protein CMJ77_22095 [Planctomycetaceae bacterium]|nr:hypothetical protein [Planctomycetaceae bacterium]